MDHLTLESLVLIERRQKDVDLAKRLRIVVLAAKGWGAEDIAMAIGLSRRMCQKWVQRYNAQGIEGLKNREGRGRPSALSTKQEELVRKRLDDGPMPEDKVCTLRGVDVKRILENEFDVRRSLSSVYNILHYLGYSCLQPRPKHYRADPELQEQFRSELPDRLKQIKESNPDRDIRVYFQDEARFGQQGTITRVWAKKGTRPEAIRQTEYEYLWVIGAVCPENGHAEGLLSPRLNVDVINVFLQEFSKSLPEDVHAVMIWDGAGFHTGNKVEVPDNVSVIVLPPYSPELNPMENLWHYLKSHYWSNRTYSGYEELERAAVEAWHDAVLDEELMKTVCAATNVFPKRN